VLGLQRFAGGVERSLYRLHERAFATAGTKGAEYCLRPASTETLALPSPGKMTLFKNPMLN
jgi:hypothetical protein